MVEMKELKDCKLTGECGSYFPGLLGVCFHLYCPDREREENEEIQ